MVRQAAASAGDHAGGCGVNWTSIIAIYILFWVASAFVLLPFGIKTHEELCIDKIP